MVKEKKNYITVLAVISSLAVVAMHVNNCGRIFSYEPYWISGNIIDGICICAVPIFFMLSGANLIGYRERYDTKTYFAKRLKKTVFPFVVWSFIGMLFLWKEWNLAQWNLGQLALGIINTTYIDVYWFFTPLFMCYLVIPVFADIEKKQQVFKYMILVGFVLEFILPYMAQKYGIGYSTMLHVPMFGDFFWFLILGYYIDNFEISRRIRVLIYIAGVIGLVYIIFGTWHMSYQFGDIYPRYKSYTGLPVVAYSVAVFLLIKTIGFEKWDGVIAKVFDFLAGTTFGVYLIHRGVIEIVYRYTDIDVTNLSYRTIGVIVIFLVSALAVKILQKLPIVKHIVP